MSAWRDNSPHRRTMERDGAITSLPELSGTRAEFAFAFAARFFFSRRHSGSSQNASRIRLVGRQRVCLRRSGVCAGRPSAQGLFAARIRDVRGVPGGIAAAENKGKGAENMSELALIDLSGIFHAAWHASVNEEVSHAQGLTVAKVRQIAAKHALVAVCCDQGRSFRKTKHPEYKANRGDRNEALYAELDRTRERLAADGLLLWACDTFEADDLIATATREAVKREFAVAIYSNDKDLTQLVGEGVTQVSTMTGASIDAAAVAGKFGVGPSQMRDWLALVGDASDNIKGVRGVGPKNAAILLDKHGTIDGIYDAINKTPQDFKPAQMSALLDARETIKVAKWLIDLRYDAPIKFDEIFEKREAKPIAKGADLTNLPDSEIDESEPWNDKAIVTESTVANAPQPAANPAEKVAEPDKTEPAPAPAAIAVYQGPPDRALQPRHLREAGALGVSLFNSRLYSRFGTAEAITAVIIRGSEMGLGALTSLDVFHVVEGKPTPHAYLIIARAKQHPDCEYFQLIESSESSTTWETKNRRNPKPTRYTYTDDDARAAGLTTGNWIKRRREMRDKSAGVKLARIEYPDAALGLYAAEEMGGDE